MQSTSTLIFLKQSTFFIMSGVHSILVWISPGTKESAEIMLTHMRHSVASRVYQLHLTCVSVTAESLSSLFTTECVAGAHFFCSICIDTVFTRV